MKKRVYFGTNTKMTKTTRETVDFIKGIQAAIKGQNVSGAVLFVIPSFTALPAAREVLGGQSAVLLGAQNMCWEERGAYTGEISPLQLQEIGVDIVEIGHSERRRIFGESDEVCGKKVKSAIAHGMTALLCIGETAEQRACDAADEILTQQIISAAQGISSEEAAKLWIAYEPVWAIGEKGVPAKADYAEQRHKNIRKTLRSCFGKAGEFVPVLYGGSVGIDNAEEILQQPHVDGLFVGRSAWTASGYAELLQVILQK